MDKLIKNTMIENKLIKLNDKLVLLDRDVANLYGIETKALNQNIKKNIELFPEEFRFQLTKDEWNNLRSSEITSSSKHGGTRHLPYVFTEEGLYMVATILRSEIAKQVHFYIVKTFARIRELNRNINTMTKVKDEDTQNKLAKKTSQLLEDIIEIEDDLLDKNDGEVIETHTKFEFNLGFAKVSKSVKRVKS